MLILDTHVLLWLDVDSPRLGPQARSLIERHWAQGTVGVCAISFWEVATLQRKGRIEMAMPLNQWRQDWLRAGLQELAISSEVAVLAGELADFHGDPADRLITAAAWACGAVLLTADARILDWSGSMRRHDARV